MYRGKFELFTLSDKSPSLAFPKVGCLLAMVVDVLLPDQARFSNVPQFTHSMALVWTINLRTNHLPLRGACNLQEAQESIWESYHASPCIPVFWKKKFLVEPFQTKLDELTGWWMESKQCQQSRSVCSSKTTCFAIMTMQRAFKSNDGFKKHVCTKLMIKKSYGYISCK